MKLCTVEDCRGDIKSGDRFCEKHRARWRRHGDPNVVLKDHTPAVERWKKLYTVDPKTNCWNWTGQKSRGYGVISDGAGKQHVAHRFVYEQTGGVLVAGLELDHKCRNTGCVNPKHLDQVTHALNVQRSDAGIRNAEKTRCDSGHEFTPENTYITPKGYRSCRTCTRIAVRESQRRKRAKAQAALATATECKNGHEYTAETEYIGQGGSRQCRICSRIGGGRGKPKS